MKRRRRKRTGRAGAALLVTLLAGWLTLGAAAAADEKSPATAIIAGSVYRDTGFSLAGAQVRISGKEKGKKKEWRAVSSIHGEFTVRVPAGPADYNISVRANGYQIYEKPVTVGADERVELSIILEPAKEKR